MDSPRHHRSTYLHAMSACMVDALALSEAERVLPVVPLFHACGWGLPYAAPLTGADLVLAGADTSPANLARIIETERVTWAAACRPSGRDCCRSRRPAPPTCRRCARSASAARRRRPRCSSDDFRAAGWSDQELWALSYNGLGGNNGSALTRTNPERDAEHRAMGKDATTYVTENDVNVADLHAFLLMVRTYTGSKRFMLVGHSLGVTLARETLRVHPELRKDLVAFVGIAGANRGTSFCAPGSEGKVVSCDEIAAGTPWLARLNAAGETYGPARWMTVYDGSGVGDPAFAGPSYAQSPRLEGADNQQYPATYHNDLRLDPAIVADYREFLEAAGTLRR